MAQLGLSHEATSQPYSELNSNPTCIHRQIMKKTHETPKDQPSSQIFMFLPITAECRITHLTAFTLSQSLTHTQCSF